MTNSNISDVTPGDSNDTLDSGVLDVYLMQFLIKEANGSSKVSQYTVSDHKRPLEIDKKASRSDCIFFGIVLFFRKIIIQCQRN